MSMGRRHLFTVILVLFIAIDAHGGKPIFSSRLIHRFADEAQSLWAYKIKNHEINKTTSWPEKKSLWHMRVLLGNDLYRQRLRLGTKNQLLVASEGSQTFNYGNDLGWLHYMWVDIGTPNNSFLVALDTGSDMFWVPCNCVECASLSFGNSYMPDKEFGQYRPSHSRSSKKISCSHEFCEMGPTCRTPMEHCPYSASYMSDGTSSSGFLFEDQLHLVSSRGNKLQSDVLAKIIIGCGSKQSGAYLQGIAPDGVMGLGPGDISVPSLLAKLGLVPHSFSFCYDKSYSGRLFFGDQGPASQNFTPFVRLKGDQYVAYIVQVETYCIGRSCLKQTGYEAQIDTGSSFTYLPSYIYEQVASEFHKQANATRITMPQFENCYKARSLKVPNIPSMNIVFSMNQSLVIENPMLHLVDDQGEMYYCLGIIRMDEDFGIIGQNFLMGYRIVFDWEKLKLGWSISNCQDIDYSGEIHLRPPPSDASPNNSLPTNEQQQEPHGDAIPPAVAGRASSKPSAASPPLALNKCHVISLLLLLWTAYISQLI